MSNLNGKNSCLSTELLIGVVQLLVLHGIEVHSRQHLNFIDGDLKAASERIVNTSGIDLIFLNLTLDMDEKSFRQILGYKRSGGLSLPTIVNFPTLL